MKSGSGAPSTFKFGRIAVLFILGFGITNAAFVFWLDYKRDSDFEARKRVAEDAEKLRQRFLPK